MKKIYKGMQNGTEAIQENFDELNGRKSKILKVTLSTGYTPWDGSDINHPTMIVSPDGLVALSGIVKNASTISKGTESLIGTIPKEAIPAGGHNFICQASGSNEYMLTVNQAGNVILSRHRSGNTQTDCGADSFINVNGFWMIEQKGDE